MICPRCSSNKLVTTDCIHNGKPQVKCNPGGRQLVEDPQNRPLLDSTKPLIDKLWLERISLAGIGRTTGVSEKGLSNYQAIKYANLPSQLVVNSKKTGNLLVPRDEFWSVVNPKNNKPWVWIAIDAETREMVGLHVGDRSQTSAKALWGSWPPVYRPGAVG